MRLSKTGGISKAGLMSLAAVAVLAAGCQSERLGNLDTVSPPPPPPPLRAAPAGNVQASALPAPGASSFPPPPAGSQGAAAGQPGGTQTASLEPPATAEDLTPAKIGGVWNASLSGQTCKIATPQTKFGQGYRAGPVKCPAELANLKSWSVSGKQLVLYDANGGTLAQLYSSGGDRFDGQTTSGQPISLSR
jgi:hypothetical protein